jgi:hypothetical protein
MNTARAMNLIELGARIARDEYVVDEDAVAEAIVRRAMDRQGSRRRAIVASPFASALRQPAAPSAA